jgi:hypothetical protein
VHLEIFTSPSISWPEIYARWRMRRKFESCFVCFSVTADRASLRHRQSFVAIAACSLIRVFCLHFIPHVARAAINFNDEISEELTFSSLVELVEYPESSVCVNKDKEQKKRLNARRWRRKSRARSRVFARFLCF